MLIKNNLIKIILKIIAVIALTAIIIFAPLRYYLYNFKFYDKLYKNNGVYDVLDKNDVKIITNQVFDFFRYNKQFESFKLKSDYTFFTKDQIEHLNDVRILIKKILLFFYISSVLFSIIIIISFEKNFLVFIKKISTIIIYSSIVVIFFIFLLFILSRNFERLFENFHLVFFPQGNWMFDKSALIITIFPFGFFYDFFYRLVIVSLIISIILLIIFVIFLIITKNKEGLKKINEKIYQ